MKILFGLIIDIYPLLCVFIPCIIYQIILKKTHAKKMKLNDYIWSYIFILYIFIAFTTAGIGSIWEIGKYDEIIRLKEISIIPFQSLNPMGIFLYVLNIIMFMPLGFLLPLLWNKYRNLKSVLLCGLMFSGLIEITQLFNRRATDIDDLIMNVIGTLLGYLIWKRIFVPLSNRFTIFNKLTKFSELSRNEGRNYLLLSILGTFFLYNWRLLVRILEKYM